MTRNLTRSSKFKNFFLNMYPNRAMRGIIDTVSWYTNWNRWRRFLDYTTLHDSGHYLDLRTLVLF